MGKLDKFQVVINNPKGVFYPGEEVSGRADIVLKEEMKINEIRARFHGYANVHWTEQRHTKNGSYTVHFRNHETFFDQKIVLVKKEHGRKDDLILKPGSYSYPVSFILPPKIPSSYEAKIGRVRYYIQVTIDRPWAFDDHTKAMFTVADLFDLNTRPELVNGAKATDQKVLCCLCCASDPIIATIDVGRQGYVPGEMIVFNADINNKSNRTMTCSKASLIQQVKYHATNKTRTVNNCLQEQRHGKIEGGGTDVWRNERLFIPPVPPSYLLGCKIIDIRYLVMITVDPSGIGFDLDVPVEVVIGSIPLASIAQQYGVNIPQTIAPPPAGAPAGLYTDPSSNQTPGLAMPNLPPPSYAESAFGRVNTREDNDDEHTTGNSDYAPVYTYYNWEKQDPASHFTVQMNEN